LTAVYTVTRVDFYTHVADRHEALAWLIRRTLARGRRLMLLAADADSAARLDRQLWCQPQTGFVPHCGLDSPLRDETPVIVDWRPDPAPHDDLLVNLGAAAPAGFARYRQLVELVGLDDEDVRRARARWKFYAGLGYQANSHDLSTGEPRTTRGQADD
jgi:DNA polymerase-3 subunit chi